MYVSYKVIGSHIRNTRKARGFTQEEIAERIGISALHYGRLERSARQASLEQIAHIANVLHVPTFALLDGCILHEPFSATPTSNSISFAEQLARITAVCSPQEHKTLLEICAAFAKHNK